MALEVKLQVFEGPLDLLLHLIDKNKVDIYDIPIVTITQQYMDYIRQMQHDDMDVTSEFLVMAATLIDIKCRMLLPKEVNEDGEEEDPRAELVEKLLEYKMYKYMSYELRDRQVNADLYFYREKNIPEEIEGYEAPIDYGTLIGENNLSMLNGIFQGLLRRQEDRVDPVRSKFGKIEKEEVDMDLKTEYVRDYIKVHKRFSFRQLLEKQHSKSEIVVTFLVILEEMKLGEIEIEQQETFGDIVITSRRDVNE
ncbi:MAG: segregation/condensation protein A [Butyrivibrio sp.]|jgi:segregation and condensation protein A|nr:segregation/condensation protein A [Butyrivibrio sp.]